MSNPKKIKVVYIVKSSTPYGSNVALLNLLQEITKYNVAPLVLYCEDGPFVDWLKEREIPTRKISNFSYNIYPPKKTFKNLLAYVPRFVSLVAFRNRKAVSDIVSIAREFNADLIHTNVGPVDVGFQAAAQLNIPHLWHIREYQNLDFKMTPFPSFNSFKERIKKSSIISISKDLFQHFDMGDNAKVVYDGVLKKDQVRFVDKKQQHFLFVGRINESKNVKLVVEAFIEFSETNKDFELHIAGNGPQSYLKELKSLIDEHALEHRIKFLGFRTDRHDLMAVASAIIVSSVREGFGFITVEAIYNGCLVVGLNSGGTKEILEENGLGLLYDNRDQLVKHLLEIADKGVESFYPMISKSQQYGIDLYSIEHSTAIVYKYYNEILNY